MSNLQPRSGGFWVFLPYALTVLGAACGVFWVTAGGGNANPFIWLVIGAVAGRVLAFGLVRLARALGADA